MPEMTPAAGGFLHAVLEQAKAPVEAAIRLEIEGGTLISRLDEPRPGDAALAHEGRKVLVLDDRVAQLLDGMTIDLQPSPEGDKLVLV